MKHDQFLPEGALLRTDENRRYTQSPEGLRAAMQDGVILEGRSFLCDGERNLHVSVGAFRGVMPKSECVYSYGGETKDIAIISRVGKPVCFVITDIATDENGNRARKRNETACTATPKR